MSGKSAGRAAWPATALVGLNAIAFTLLVSQYFGSGLADRPLALRHSSDALATAVTAARGLAHDSTYAIELFEYFRTAGPYLTNEQLRESLTIPVRRPHERLVYSKGNDLGLPKFVSASFLLCGLSLRAPHYLFFIVLGVSLLLLVVGHRRDPAALCLALFAVLAVHAMTFVLALSTQLWTAIDVRFISVLAILPCLDLALVTGSRRWSWHGQVRCLPQAAFVAAVFQVRSASAWTIVCLISVAVWTLVAARRSGWAVRATAAAPLAVTGLLLVALTIYQRHGLNEQYRTTITPGHVFWHSLHAGFAADPELAARYRLGFSDMPSYLSVMRSVEAHEPERVQAVFGTDGSVFDYRRVNLLEYERAARRMVTQIVRDEPRAVIAAFVYYKPLMFIRTLAWVTGFSQVDVRAIAIEPDWVSPPAERTARDEYLRWFRPAAACLFLLAVACAVCSRRTSSESGPHGPTQVVVPAMFLASALPGLFVWPAFHWSADALITTGMLLYAVAAWCAYVAFEFGASVAMRRPL
jgi:hypothetical protein